MEECRIFILCQFQFINLPGGYIHNSFRFIPARNKTECFEYLKLIFPVDNFWSHNFQYLKFVIIKSIN